MHLAYERASSAETRGPDARSQALGLQQHIFDRCNSSDGVDPAVARQLASAVEDKLKLAPILAKRLERVSHSSGSFSSRQSVTVPGNTAGTSGRSTPQRPVPASDYSKLNYLVTSLEGIRGERNFKVEGSARLPQVVPKDQSGSPTTTSRNGHSHNFDEAKQQVDRDLRLFLEDVRDLYAQINIREGADVPIVLEVIASIMDIAEECLETPVEDFKLTITDIVDNIEEERSACQQRTIRALYTRLLFILTRCSRLLITEQQHLFATEPRNRRRHSQVFGPSFTTKTQKELALHLPPQNQAGDAVGNTKDDEEPVFRSHTMPVKAMYNMVQQLKMEGPLHHSGAWMGHRKLNRIQSELPDSPSGVSAPQVDPSILRHQSKSSDLDGVTGVSESSFSGTIKKKKSFFNKLSKGLKNLTDGFKRKSSNLKDKDSVDGLSRPHSEVSQQGQQHVRFRLSTEQPQRSPASPAASMRGPKSPETGDGSVHTPTRRLDKERSVRFQETPVHLTKRSEDICAEVPHVANVAGSAADADNGKRAKLMVQTDMQRTPEDSRTSSSPQASCELEALGQGRTRLFRRASVDLYALGPTLGLESMSPDAMPPDDLTVICSICEEAWLSTHLEEHSIHCAVLRTLSGNGLSVDAQLTTIANVLEEWLETPLAFPALGPAPSQYHVKNQLVKLIRAARNAAALQPDGSKVPTTRCFSLQGELTEMLQLAAHANKLAIVTQTYAHRVMRLIAEKVNLLSEPFGGGARVRASGGSDAGDSGTSTPRSMPGMSIDEFEIIKPISRGAFGRVYLARKLATGDLFAIKVMKKRDLIRKNMVESVTNERNILAMAQNPFVVRFYYSFTSRENLYIVMEYINGGDCFSLLRKFEALDEEVARQYIAETVLALEYCHAQGIIHRDLKPDNLLINAQGHVKLTDFGLSCVGVIDRTDNLNGTQSMDTDGPEHENEAAWGSSDANGEFVGASGGEPMDASKPDDASGLLTSADGSTPGAQLQPRTSAPGQTNNATASSLGLPPRPLGQHQRIVAPEHECRRAVGTPDYLAPELLLGTGHGPEVDWWALGAILYEFVTGTPPFNADTPEEIFDNILDRRITWPDEDDMSSECRDLIDKLLHPNPLKRLGHRGAGEVKLHPWFEGLDWTGLVRNKAAFIPAVEDETDTSYFESKHVSQRSMAEDLDKLRAGGFGGGGGERTSAQPGPSSAQAGILPASGPSASGMAQGRTQVERLKDQYHREGSGMRSMGSSNSHGSSHMSRTSYTGHAMYGNTNSCGQIPIGNCPESTSEMARLYSSPFHGGAAMYDSGMPVNCNGRSSANAALISGILNPRMSAGSSSCGAHMTGFRNSASGIRASGSGIRNSACGVRNSGSGVRTSGSGARASGSGSAGPGMSDRLSPGSAGTGGGGPGPAGDMDPYAEEEYDYADEGCEGDVEQVDELGPDEEEADQEQPQHREEQSATGSGDDALEVNNGHDPFGNFSFTNFTGLSAANMEKIQKLREHFNRRTSYSGPGT